MNPLDLIDGFEKAIKIGKAIHDRYKIYTHADSDLKQLDSHIRTCLFVLDGFEIFIRIAFERVNESTSKTWSST